MRVMLVRLINHGFIIYFLNILSMVGAEGLEPPTLSV